jgi:leucyl aminopeptidase
MAATTTTATTTTTTTITTTAPEPTHTRSLTVRCDEHAPDGAVIARGVFRDRLAEEAADDAGRAHFALVGFEAKNAQIHVSSSTGRVEVLVGLGDREAVTATSVRHAVAALVRACGRTDTLAVTLLADLGDALAAEIAAGAIAASARSVRYRFDAHRSTPNTDGPAELVILLPDGCSADDRSTPGPAIAAAVERACIIARGVDLARDLVNEPGGTLTATEFARRCTELAGPQLQVIVHDHAAIRGLGMGGLLGVNSGSTEPATFVELHYTPPQGATTAERPRLALIGKGITFDTGGINLKTKPSSLLAMKNDMGGAAAIVGALSVFADLAVPTPVSAYLPLTDNMTGGGATRPGDVLRMYNGRTVEVVDTDAEGRIVLGDALAYSTAHAGAAAVLSVATLTGTQIHATGTDIAAMIGRDQSVIDQVMAASARCTDRVWQLPRVAEYGPLLKSGVADMTNRSEAPAASAFAALFLESFIDDTPWAHIDMAAVATRDRDTPDGPAGGRGWGVELLIELANSFEM